MNSSDTPMIDGKWNSLYKIGGWAALLQLLTVLFMMAVGILLGAKPEHIQEYFSLYEQNKLAVLLRSDYTSLVLIALYLGTFPALYMALQRVNPVSTLLATLFTLTAVTTCFSTHSGFSLVYLGEQYLAAGSEAQRASLLAAGQAIFASDLWNSSGAYMSGILLQGGGVIISLVMLRSKNFSKVTAYAGVLANAFDLAQHLLHPFAPSISAVLIMLMGPFYLVWFPMLARDLLRLGQSSAAAFADEPAYSVI